MENKIYNYPNSSIDRMIEQMQQSMKPIVNRLIVLLIKTVFN